MSAVSTTSDVAYDWLNLRVRGVDLEGWSPGCGKVDGWGSWATLLTRRARRSGN
jgi:hypothetical protein